MNPVGSNRLFPTKTIKIFIRGIEKASASEVTTIERKRIDTYFRELAAAQWMKDFIVFETSDHRTAMIVRGRDVKSPEYRERLRFVITTGPFPFHMNVCLHNKPAPPFTNIHEPSDASWLMAALDSEPLPIQLFSPVVDFFGRIFTIPVGALIRAEVDSPIVDAGYENCTDMKPKSKAGGGGTQLNSIL